MSTTSAGPRGSLSSDAYVDEDRGYGWVLFAGAMLSIVGMLNFIYGIAAVSNSKFFINDAKFVISDLNTWGWIGIAVGAIQVVSAFGIWARAAGARWVGIITAGVNAIIQMLVIPQYPFLAVSLFAIDILIIYGLLAHGRRPTA